MPEIANVNGKICLIHEAVVPAEDRGCLFGDGVYEVLRCYNGRMWAYHRHIKRLERSLREIEIRNLDLGGVDRWVRETYEQSQIPDATAYIHISRGAAPRSHSWSIDLLPTFLMTVRPFAARGQGNEQGIRVVTVEDQRWNRRDIKSLNLLPNVLAKQKARNQGAYEAIFLDAEARVLEGTSSAVLCIMDGVLYAPPNSTAILPSITRQFVQEIATEFGIRIVEKSVSLEDFCRADEAFIAGTGDEIMGITHVNGKAIGDGRVGNWTRKIHGEYRNRIVRGQDEPLTFEISSQAPPSLSL